MTAGVAQPTARRALHSRTSETTPPTNTPAAMACDRSMPRASRSRGKMSVADSTETLKTKGSQLTDPARLLT